MLNEKEALEKEILLLLRNSARPAGCGSLSTALQTKGLRVSEATIGRILRDLDCHDYTSKAGYQGRRLSETGENRLSALLQAESRFQWNEEIAQIVKGHTKEHLLEVLVARSAIEGALAALAAESSSRSDLAGLMRILRRQKKMAETNLITAAEDIAFHAELARISGNKVLSAAIALIRQDHQLSPVLEAIRQRVGSRTYVDHNRIFSAIRSHDPVAAKIAMCCHIEGLIKDVKKYWGVQGGSR